MCVFQILWSRKTIGSVEECDGLYLLQVKDSNKKPKANSCDWQSLFQHPSHSPSDHLPNQQNRHFNSLESVWLFSFCSQPEGICMYTSSSNSAIRKAFLISSWCKGQFRFAAKDKITRTELSLATVQRFLHSPPHKIG